MQPLKIEIKLNPDMIHTFAEYRGKSLPNKKYPVQAIKVNFSVSASDFYKISLFTVNGDVPLRVCIHFIYAPNQSSLVWMDLFLCFR